VANAWNCFQLQITTHSSAGAYEIRVADVRILRGTNVNTQGAGSTAISSFGVTANNLGSMYVDSIAVCDSTGTDNNKMII
jgi:hypothetical protein